LKRTEQIPVAAPIAIFAFNRVEHLRQTIKTLIACDGFQGRQITVFIDGPRDEADIPDVLRVRDLARELLPAQARIHPRDENIGLASSIVLGVADILISSDRVIVIEDDLELSPAFLGYMDAALEKYRDDETVYQISGHIFDTPELGEKEAVVLPLTTTWGWATWKRAWAAYDPAAEGWHQLLSDRKLRHRFNLNDCYPFSWLMERQARGLSNSWGIRWYWSVFRKGGVGIFPPKTMVRNHGQDGSGTHGGGVVANFSKNDVLLENAPALPDEIRIDEHVLASVSAAVWRESGGWRGWMLNRLRRLTEI
jgi:hypothetical protein